MGSWECGACGFSENSAEGKECLACGTEQPITSSESDSANQLVTISLPKKQKLGVKLLPPKNGVISYGLAIDNIDNPLLDGKVKAGDLIVSIGGEKVHELGFSQAIELIRSLPRPLEITFEVDEERRQKKRHQKQLQHKKELQQEQVDIDSELTTYAVVFDAGPMGLNLEEAVRYGIDGAVVKALKGQAKDRKMISVGDIVCKVNGTDVLSMPYQEVMNTIRDTPTPRTIQFVPKEKLAEVQRVNSRQSVMMRTSSIGGGVPPMGNSASIRDSTTTSKYARSSRIIRSDGMEDDSKSIHELILANQAATIKKGRMYKQSRLLRSWKSRYFVLSVSKLEYFKSPALTSSRGEMSFLDRRCTVRHLPPQENEVVCKSLGVTAKFLIELRVSDKKLVMACTSETDLKSWLDALKLAIDASKTFSRSEALGQSVAEANRVRGSRTNSMQLAGDDKQNAGKRRGSEIDYNSFPTPILHCTVHSASNLAKKNSSVNALCEVTLGAETFKTSIVKNQRSPVWKQDNSASFEAKNEEAVIEIRIFDEHVFRSTELLSTLTIPLKSLPNKKRTLKKYPLVLSNRGVGAQLTLSIEYVNEAKAWQKAQEQSRLTHDLSRASVMLERDEMLKIQKEAQEAADEAQQVAKKAEEDAKQLLEEAQRKADAAASAAHEEAEQGKAAYEAAIAEAMKAKEEAEAQAAEAKRAQEEAQSLIEANSLIQQKSRMNMADQEQFVAVFSEYRKLLMDNVSQEDVRKKMEEDGVDEANISAFFEGIVSYDMKIKELQAEVDALTRGRKKQKKQEETMNMFGNMSQDQEKLLRRLLKLEKQLQQAGITIAEDIPYEEAKAKVMEISQRMQEIGSADVVHKDPVMQKQLREEYFKLEQDMEKYNTALMLTDEYAAEEQRKDDEWEEENKAANTEALKAIRRMMPVDIKKKSEAELVQMKLPREVARKFKRTNVLELLRIDPLDIAKVHPSLLENLRVTGLTVTERRALHVHLREIAMKWKSQEQEEMAGRKASWFKSLLATFKSTVNPYNKHVEQYGPPGNHPYATRDDPDVGCPLIGRQCPLKSNANPSYDKDLGFPEGDVYMASQVQKSDANNDAGAAALREAKELARNKLANARANALKDHYKGNVRKVAAANGICEHMDETLDKIELRQTKWWEKRLGTASTVVKQEVTGFNELLSELRLASLTFCERSGMKLSGKRNPKTDDPDTRSHVEMDLAELVVEAVRDVLEAMKKRCKELKTVDKRVITSMDELSKLITELHEKNKTGLAIPSTTTSVNKKAKGTIVTRRVKLSHEIRKEVKEKLAKKAETAEEQPEGNSEASGGRGGRGNPMGGRGGLLSALAGRGKEGRGGRGRGGLMDAIAGRGRGRGEGGGNPLMNAIAARGRGKQGDGEGGRAGGNPLMAAIAARGRGKDTNGRGGDLFSAIRARGNGAKGRE